MTNDNRKSAPPRLVKPKKTPPQAVTSEEEVTCRICGKKSVQKKVKSHLLVERDLDVDLRPRQIAWSVKHEETTNPAHFYMYSCPHCFFTAPGGVFENPLRNANIPVRRFKSKMEEALVSNSGLRNAFAELTRTTHAVDNNHYLAVKMHLLAIFLLEIVDEMKQRDSLNLGRYCLRLAWLFEELEESPDLKERFGEQIDSLLGTLAEDWPDVPNGIRRARESALEYYVHALEFSRSIESVKEEVDLHLLIARIAMKLGDIPLAGRFISGAREKVRRLDSENRMGKTTDSVKTAADIRRMRSAGEMVQIIFEKLREVRSREQEERAKLFVKSNPGKTPDELRELMIAQKFDPGAVDAAVPRREKKKGILGGLFQQ